MPSPPYWGLRDYGHADQLGLEQTPEEYIAAMVDVFVGVRRVLRDDGTLWLIIGDSYSRGVRGPTGTAKQLPGLKPGNLVGIPWRLALALQADGWYLRSDIIWSKPNPMPESVRNRPTRSHEYVFLLAKSLRYYYDKDAVAEPAISGHAAGNGFVRPARRTYTNVDASPRGSDAQRSRVYETRNRRDVWSIATKPFRGAHFAVMPALSPRGCWIPLPAQVRSRSSRPR